MTNRAQINEYYKNDKWRKMLSFRPDFLNLVISAQYLYNYASKSQEPGVIIPLYYRVPVQQFPHEIKIPSSNKNKI